MTEALDADRALVRRCLAGEGGARRQFVAAYLGPVRQTTGLVAARWRMSVGADDVEDAVQQAFLTFFARDMLVLSRWRGDARLGTYLNRVAERVALRHFQAISGHRGRFPLVHRHDAEGREVSAEEALESLVHAAQVQGLAEAAPDLEQRLQRGEALTEIRESVLARLSEKGRDFYRHLFVDELDVAEICRREETNANNVYQWKNRILREVAAVLNSHKNGIVSPD